MQACGDTPRWVRKAMTAVVRLLAVFLRVGVLNELQYRTNLYVQLLRSAISLGTGLAGLGVVFSHTETLAGWSPPELLAILGVYFVVSGVLRFAIQPAMERLMEGVRNGTLDYVLTKPEDSLVLVSVRAVEVWRLADVALGSVIIGVAVTQMPDRIGLWQVTGFVLAILAAVTTVYSFLLLLTTLSFWFVRLENILVIFQSMYEAGKWPVNIYPAWLRSALTFLVPVAFATTVPAQALAGRLTPEALVGAVALSAGLFTAARLFWAVGLRRYSGASA